MKFAEFDKMIGNRKTGTYNDLVDMFTRRDGSGERVFRVRWFERNPKYATHADYKKALRKASAGIGYHKLGREWVEKNELFPYTAEGLAAAVKFAETIKPKWDAFYNREDD